MGNSLHTITGTVIAGFVLLVLMVVLILLLNLTGTVVWAFVVLASILAAIELTILTIP